MPTTPSPSPTPQAAAPEANPFFSVSTLPYRIPPFEAITLAHFRPAFERGMAEQLAEIEAITSSTESPDFANTFLALERSGQLLHRVSRVFYNQAASDTSPEL